MKNKSIAQIPGSYAGMHTFAHAILLISFIFQFNACSGSSPSNTEEIIDGWSFSWNEPSFYTSLKHKNSSFSAEKENSPALSSSKNIWHPYDFNTEPHDRMNRSILWIRLRLSEKLYNDPALFIPIAFVGFEAFYENRLIYSSAPVLQTGEIKLNGIFHNIVPIPPDYSGKFIYFRLYSNYIRIGFVKPAWMGSRLHLMLKIIKEFGDIFIVGTIITMIGMAALVISFLRHHEFGNMNYSFAFFSLSMGIWLICNNPVFNVIMDQPDNLFYLANFTQGLWTIGIILFHEHMLGSGPYRITRKLFYSAAVLKIAEFLTLTANHISPISEFVFRIIYTLDPLLLLAIIFILPSHALYRALKKDRDAQILTVAIATLAAFGFIEILTDLNIIKKDRMYYHYGVLIYILLLGFLEERRIRRTSMELLENKVALSLTERDLEISQLKLLQDRMNPHFLFNSLSALHAMLERKSYSQAKDTSIILAEHYQFLTDQSQNSLIPLEEELAFSENFLKMQKIRFGDNFYFKINQNASVQNVLIPPLTIQPLIENAIKHGLRKISGTGSVQISIDSHENGVKIQIEDNGAGLLVSNPYERTLGNILKRLQYYYNEATLEIKNRNPEPGAMVSVFFRNFKRESDKS